MPLVSIIIPVYNSEKYLKECLNSLVQQSFKDIEILCLVCKSKDNSLEIVKEYSKNDSRVVLIERPYEFAGASRNAGIKLAKGKYILFVDSDDTLNEFACEYSFKILEANNADIAYFNAENYSNGKFVSKVFDFTKTLKDKKDSVIYPKNDDTDIFSLPNFIWAKCFRKDFLIKNEIEFDDLKFAEDVAFQIKSYAKAQKIVIKDIPIYYYKTYSDNSTSKFDSHYEDLINAYKNMYEYLKTLPYKNLLESFCICIVHTLLYFYSFSSLSEENKKHYYKHMRSLFIKIEMENNIVWNDYKQEISAIVANKGLVEIAKASKQRTVAKMFLFGLPFLYVKQSFQDRYYYLFKYFKFFKKSIKG